jgi:hypothetical protein
MLIRIEHLNAETCSLCCGTSAKLAGKLVIRLDRKEAHAVAINSLHDRFSIDRSIRAKRQMLNQTFELGCLVQMAMSKLDFLR